MTSSLKSLERQVNECVCKAQKTTQRNGCQSLIIKKHLFSSLILKTFLHLRCQHFQHCATAEHRQLLNEVSGIVNVPKFFFYIESFVTLSFKSRLRSADSFILKRLHQKELTYSPAEEAKERLENCQKTALRIIFGLNISYDLMRINYRLPTLNERRKFLFEKFSRKMAGSERFQKKWLPKKDIESDRELRNRKEYIDFFARTERLYRSPLFEMRRILNS